MLHSCRKCYKFNYSEAYGGNYVLNDNFCIDWKIPTEHVNLSEKKLKHEILKNFGSPFDMNMYL